VPSLHSRTPLVVLALLASRTSAQSTRVTRAENNVWLTSTADVWVTPTWGAQAEVLYERSDLGAKPQAVELRLGAQHQLHSGARLAVGGTFIHTSPYGPFPSRAPFQEYRAWEQATIDQRLGVVSLTHRYRLEERFIMRPVGDATDPTYTLRARYQLRASVPLTRPSARRSVYAAAWDEVFVGLGPHTPNNVLDQNRVFVGGGARWSPLLRTDLGYMNQVILRASGTQIENNHTVLLNFAVTRAARRR
jgi:hypothetical protein